MHALELLRDEAGQGRSKRDHLLRSREEGMQEHALELLRETWHDRVAPDTITVSAAFVAFEAGMQWQHALELLREMLHYRVAPDLSPLAQRSALARRERNGSMRWCSCTRCGMTGSRQTRSLQRSDQRFEKGLHWKPTLGALARDVA